MLVMSDCRLIQNLQVLHSKCLEEYQTHLLMYHAGIKFPSPKDINFKWLNKEILLVILSSQICRSEYFPYGKKVIIGDTDIEIKTYI